MLLLMRNTARTWLADRRTRPESCERLLGDLPLRLLQQPDSQAPLLALLASLTRHTPARRAWLLLPAPQDGGWQELGEAPDACPHGQPLSAADGPQRCVTCLAAGRHRLICPLELERGRLAVLLLDYRRPPGWLLQRQAAQLAARLGEVLRALRQGRARGRRETAIDPALLARELHDSVAQQLSYLQIRATRLQAVLDEPEQVRIMAHDLQEQLRCVHRQVRALIAAARPGMNGRSLRQALEACVAEFSRRSSCVFELDNRLPAEHLPDAVAFEVLQVVREALTNVMRHSHARQVLIELREQDRQGFELRLSDDGLGLRQMPSEHGHYGLRIMQERATAIGAELSIGPAEPCGTLVRLRWSPP